MERVEICTNIHCPIRLDCLYFQTAVDFKGRYYSDIVDCGGDKFKSSRLRNDRVDGKDKDKS